MLLIHDLDSVYFQSISSIFPKDTTIVSKDMKNIHPCCGCFNCWIKNPGKCVINDDYTIMPKLFIENDTIIVITKVKYGCYSSYIKNVIERSIGYLLPFLINVNGETHHSMRYKNKIPKMIFIGYSDDITSSEKKTFLELIKGNAINFGAENKYECHVVDNLQAIDSLLFKEDR
ncbi:MAG: flavodoxin family protein [Clostridium butyricum]|nr:flavodoxin family protein [Clostridium butyricum]